jgi:hypothetical protein
MHQRVPARCRRASPPRTDGRPRCGTRYRGFSRRGPRRGVGGPATAAREGGSRRPPAAAPRSPSAWREPAFSPAQRNTQGEREWGGGGSWQMLRARLRAQHHAGSRYRCGVWHVAGCGVAGGQAPALTRRPGRRRCRCRRAALRARARLRSCFGVPTSRAAALPAGFSCARFPLLIGWRAGRSSLFHRVPLRSWLCDGGQLRRGCAHRRALHVQRRQALARGGPRRRSRRH